MPANFLGATPAASSGSFKSGARTVRIEEFRSAVSGPRPAVIILHGASGMESARIILAAFAANFARHGFATYLLHYFDSTKTSYAGDAEIHRCFSTWLQTVGDAISHVMKQPGVDPKKIGLFGYSLGAYLAVARSLEDPGIGAVVELAGGVDDSYARKAAALPPLLILHGTEDERVPASAAADLERLATKLGSTKEIHLYAGEGHILTPASFFDAMNRGTDFFQRFLRHD